MRTRIIALAVLASVVATVLFAVPLGIAVFRHLVGQERGHLLRVANDVAITVADDVEAGADDDLLFAAAPVTHGEDIIGAVLVSESRADVYGELVLTQASPPVSTLLLPAATEPRDERADAGTRASISNR
ncbi:hypothetical protein [Geodermatophilus sabuli]|uniref:Uncharacterized protein n=1 Tax=Geodermatophilus sabuli TaxID=1564158 RepID=A0A285EBK6_9ACTN|nr:hypothetical protein [Geodermatophilus sabuli]MBB3084362.1 hypothetical protein [Geodermatophilus sabuli]SNX96370.1 hypothetical protein SAMN06893097_10484 [Geodermatophilus sabuli]